MPKPFAFWVDMLINCKVYSSPRIIPVKQGNTHPIWAQSNFENISHGQTGNRTPGETREIE